MALAAELGQLRAILGEAAPAPAPGEGPEWTVEQEAPPPLDEERVQALQTELAALRKANKVLARDRSRLEARVARLEKKSGLPPAVAAPQLSPSVLKVEARRLMQEREQDAAVTLMEEAVGLFPDDEDLVMMLASAYCQGGRFGDAVAVLKEAVERQPERASAWILLGTANMGLGQVGDARVAMEKALKAAPLSAEAHYNMAQILMALTPPAIEPAASHYSKALTLGSPSDVAFEETLRQATLLRALDRSKK
jgi:predicted Zn-dependent protease